jgi:hypothetical protein
VQVQVLSGHLIKIKDPSRSKKICYKTTLLQNVKYYFTVRASDINIDNNKMLITIIGLLLVMFSKEFIIINDGTIINVVFISLLLVFIMQFSFLKENFEFVRSTEQLTIKENLLIIKSLQEMNLNVSYLLINSDLLLNTIDFPTNDKNDT